VQQLSTAANDLNDLFAITVMSCFRLHRLYSVYEMRPIATDVARSKLDLCVCLCFGHMNVFCKNGWTDRDAIWG